MPPPTSIVTTKKHVEDLQGRSYYADDTTVAMMNLLDRMALREVDKWKDVNEDQLKRTWLIAESARLKPLVMREDLIAVIARGSPDYEKILDIRLTSLRKKAKAIAAALEGDDAKNEDVHAEPAAAKPTQADQDETDPGNPGVDVDVQYDSESDKKPAAKTDSDMEDEASTDATIFHPPVLNSKIITDAQDKFLKKIVKEYPLQKLKQTQPPEIFEICQGWGLIFNKNKFDAINSAIGYVQWAKEEKYLVQNTKSSTVATVGNEPPVDSDDEPLSNLHLRKSPDKASDVSKKRNLAAVMSTDDEFATPTKKKQNAQDKFLKKIVKEYPLQKLKQTQPPEIFEICQGWGLIFNKNKFDAINSAIGYVQWAKEEKYLVQNTKSSTVATVGNEPPVDSDDEPLSNLHLRKSPDKASDVSKKRNLAAVMSTDDEFATPTKKKQKTTKPAQVATRTTPRRTAPSLYKKQPPEPADNDPAPQVDATPDSSPDRPRVVKPSRRLYNLGKAAGSMQFPKR